MNLKIGNRLLIIALKRLPTAVTAGITNHTKDNYFLPFFDYDEVEYDVVLEDVDFFQKNFDVGTVVVTASSEEKELSGKLVGNYHVIGFTKFTFPEILQIIRLSRCDWKFKKGYKFQQRCWVLRVLEKTDYKSGKDVKPAVKLKEVIASNTKRQANFAMINFINKLFNLKLRFSNHDSVEEVELINYLT